MEIKNSEDLKAAIRELEDKKHRQKQELVQNFHTFKESLTPINLLKSTFNRIKETPGITNTVLKASVGLGVGLLSKRLFKPAKLTPLIGMWATTLKRTNMKIVTKIFCVKKSQQFLNNYKNFLN